MLAQQVADWLVGLGHENVKPVEVTIEDGKNTKTWPGAVYTVVGKYDAGMAGVTSGRVKEGTEHRSNRIYLVGDLPKSSLKMIRVAGFSESKNLYRVPGNDNDWYVSGYIVGIEPQFAHAHPFGPNFMLGEWSHPEPIDKHDDKPGQRNRLVMTVKDV